MAAGLEDHVWTVHELIGLLEAAESVPVKRGAYRKTTRAERTRAGRGDFKLSHYRHGALTTSLRIRKA
jgi:hypothetical protein